MLAFCFHLAFAVVFSLSVVCGAELTPAQIPLWPGKPRQFPENAPQEITDDGGRIRNVTVPAISVFLPPNEKRAGMAILVCAGGGYGALDWKTHVVYAAQAFDAKGVAVSSKQPKHP